MNKLIAFWRSSIGKKIIMSLSGLFLCTFLLVHVAVNLFLFKRDGGETYNQVAHFMSSNVVVRTVEVVLFVGILAHMFSGVVVWIKNWLSRPVGYEMYRLKDNTKFSSRTPMLTASASLVGYFLVSHLITFWIPTRFGAEPKPPYQMVSEAFSDPVLSIFYIIAVAFLAFHLKHGFQSGFQTLGLNNKKYKWLIDAFAVIFWLIIPLAFAAMPAYFLWFKS
ncbi:MAG: succinate dehydrogenase cytochrome b subunit [Bacteroidota bacterium]